MKKLFLRMLREIRSNFGQFLSIVLILSIGSFMFTGMLSAIHSIETGVKSYYENQNMADLWSVSSGISKEKIQELSASGDMEAEGRFNLNLEGRLDENSVTLKLHSLTNLNSIFLAEGTLPKKDNECIIDSKFAVANELTIGQSVEVIQGDQRTELKITGIGDSPEYAYKVKDGTASNVSHKTYGIAFTTEETAVKLMKKNPPYLEKLEEVNKIENESQRIKALNNLEDSLLEYQEVLIKTDNRQKAINILEANENYISVTEREELPSYTNVQGSIDTISTVAYIFPFVFFMVAALIVLISMTKMIENQRMQIAVMQAIGIGKGKILCGFLFYSATASFMGSLPFALLGSQLVPKVLLDMLKNRFALGEMNILTLPILLLLPFLLALLFCCTATLFAFKSLFKEVPAQAMRPKQNKKSKAILLERISLIWRRLSYSGKLIFRNLFLNKSRVLLSSIGVICSVMLMITGLSLQSSATGLLAAKNDSIGYDLSVVYNSSISDDDVITSEQMSAVELTKNLHAKLQGTDENISIQVLPQGSQMIHLFDTKGKEFYINSDSVIIPQTLAEEKNIAVDEKIQLVIDDQNYSFTVTGISEQYTGETIYIADTAAANAGINLTYNTAMIKLLDSGNSLKVKDELINDANVKAVNTKEDIKTSAAENLETLKAVILLIVAAAGVLSVTVIYNISSINIFERQRELATLMVLGYYKKEVNKLLLAENMVLAFLGCLGGLPGGILLFNLVLSSFSNNGVMLPTDIMTYNIWISFFMAFIFSVFTNLLMHKKINKIDMIEALKGVE